MVKQPGSERFPRDLRLRTAGDFARAYERKAHAADDVLVLNAVRNGRSYSRLGLAVSRAVGGAVVRNRWKRLIRDAFRRSQDRIPAGLDLIARPRRGATPDHAAITASLVRLTSQLARRLARDAS